MVNGSCPGYLADLVPGLVSDRNPYHRRRPLERSVPKCSTELYRKSFVPSVTNQWNSLPDYIKNSNSLGQLKRYLSVNDVTVPVYFYLGERKEQVLHCRLRLGMSDLKSDLFNRHLTNDPVCACGSAQETAEHYLLRCPLFNQARAGTISTLDPDYTHVQILLTGSPDLHIKTNILIFETVRRFISNSKRF